MTRRIPIFAMVLLAAVVARAEPAGPPAERLLEIPAAWLKFEIDWKPTWDETLRTNTVQRWATALQGDPAMAPQWELIGRLRRIEVLKAMIKRWPGERGKHIDAYTEIARTYGQMGWNWWQSWWGYKLTRDFADNRQAVENGYGMVLNWNFGQYTHWGWYGYWIRPECHDWEFVIYEIMEKFKAGTLADGPAVQQAFSYYGWILVDFPEIEYGRIHPYLERIKTLGAKNPGLAGEAENVLRQFGHIQSTDSRGPMFDSSPAARQAQFELETRWEAAQHSALFQDSDVPLDIRAVQRLLDLAAATDGSAPSGGEDRRPYWTRLDNRLTAMPRARIADLAAAQNGAARPAARIALETGNGDELLRAFRRYPFAACLHEIMVDLAERDIRQGLSQWAVPVLWAVAAHTDSAVLRNQAYAGLWLALAQDPEDRGELETAMKALPDDTEMQWRGQALQAGEVKRQLLAQARVADSIPRVSLASLQVRRIELPAGWPALERNLDGPARDIGLHAPWPVSWIEQVGSSLLVGAPTAVARFDAGNRAPAWLLNPGQRVSDGAWPWPVARARSDAVSSYVTWRADRRPVRTRSVQGPAGKRLYCLLNTVEPPVVEAIDTSTGELIWSTENGPGWDGMGPLSHPDEADGRVYVLAAPQMPEPGTDSTMVHLVCLDVKDGHVLWKRPIGRLAGALRDLARGSGRVLVQEGRVYSASNVGLLARCGAHDGMLQWVQAYPFAVHRNGGIDSINPHREGAGPMIAKAAGAGQAGATIVLAPRDHSGVLAFNHETGKLLWETPLVPSDKLLGATGQEVVGINGRWLTALDLVTGKQLYCREFPAGTGSAGTLIGPDVILVTGGVLHRIQAHTGETIETRDLQAGADAEFTIMPDGTVVQIVPPALAPSPGPSTAGRKLTLPMEKVWSVPCESPRLLLREDRTAGINSFGLVTGRRVACVSGDQGWRVAWDALLPRPPQAAGFTGNNIVTAELWTLSARKVEDGRLRWSRTLPFPAGKLAGDAVLMYAAAGGDWSGPYYAAIDSVSGEQKWVRCFGPEMFGGGKATILRPEPDGSRLLRMLSDYVDPATGVRTFGEARIDAASGRIARSQPVLAPGEAYQGVINYDENGVAFFRLRGQSYWSWGEQTALAIDYNGRSLADGWKRKYDLLAANMHHGWTSVHPRGRGIYTRLDGYLLFYDPATGKEVMFDMKRTEGLVQPYIFDFREDGDRLIVVSGLTGAKSPVQGQRSPARPPPEQWHMYVDIFDLATGNSLGRQELPGVRCCVSYIAHETIAGYESQVRIGENAIVVTDTDGVHIFSSAGR